MTMEPLVRGNPESEKREIKGRGKKKELKQSRQPGKNNFKYLRK